MTEKSEREKMLDGELYLAKDKELVQMHLAALRLLHIFNSSHPDELDKRSEIVSRLLGSIGLNAEINPPFYCDYGCHIYAGDNLYVNSDCVILDCNTVHLGDNVLLAPKVQIYTAYHPIEPKTRLTGKELAKPVRIGDNVWFGGGAIVCPGVTIGSNVTIGAGSVVTKSIPDNVVAVGNPCRIVREI